MQKKGSCQQEDSLLPTWVQSHTFAWNGMEWGPGREQKMARRFHIIPYSHSYPRLQSTEQSKMHSVCLQNKYNKNKSRLLRSQISSSSSHSSAEMNISSSSSKA